MILSQKGRKGRDNPSFPPPTYLHTQEVTGSSPVVSTRKFLISCEIRNFSLYFIKIIRSYFFVFLLTQTVTHKRKRAERMRQHQVGFSLPGADFCGFFVFFGCTSFSRFFGTSHIAWLMTFPMVSAASRFISAVAWV